MCWKSTTSTGWALKRYWNQSCWMNFLTNYLSIEDRLWLLLIVCILFRWYRPVPFLLLWPWHWLATLIYERGLDILKLCLCTKKEVSILGQGFQKLELNRTDRLTETDGQVSFYSSCSLSVRSFIITQFFSIIILRSWTTCWHFPLLS